MSSDLLILLNCFVWFGKICLQPSLYKCKHKSFQVLLCAGICQTAFMSHFTGKPFAPPQAALKHQTPTQGTRTSLCISGFPYKGIRFLFPSQFLFIAHRINSHPLKHLRSSFFLSFLRKSATLSIGHKTASKP